MMIDNKRSYQNVIKITQLPILAFKLWLLWIHNLKKSPIDQIDGIILLPKQHNHSPIACSMPILALWNFLVPPHQQYPFTLPLQINAYKMFKLQKNLRIP
jgi:hypothetical protein